MSDWRIPLSIPNVDDRESKAVAIALKEGNLAIGPEQELFERKIVEITGAKFAVGVSSGTAALHLALLTLMIGPGDLVAVPDLTFIASANPIFYVGATPLLIDVKTSDGNIDTDLFIEEIKRRLKLGLTIPKAVIAVHILGEPCELDKLVTFCDEYNIAIIEDSAESIGATYGDGPLNYRSTGSIGKIGIISFNGNKIVTTGGGGALLSNDGLIVSKARHLATQAKKATRGYDHDRIGYNYQLSNISCAIGVVQLQKLMEFIEIKRKIYDRYESVFKERDDTSLFFRNRINNGICWLSTVQFESEKVRKRVEVHLMENGIECRPLWTPLHLQDPFRSFEFVGDNTSGDLGAKSLSLPSSTTLTLPDIDEVIETILNVLN